MRVIGRVFDDQNVQVSYLHQINNASFSQDRAPSSVARDLEILYRWLNTSYHSGEEWNILAAGYS